ncbi:hypothetical protein [Bifidobacterium mongoliense]|uniref:hypothetical protein n=1 Tax=Bifidobacterium mongoliense TaxID=518643 RepID=UPI0030EB5697
MNTISLAFTPIMSGERHAPSSMPDGGFILECHTDRTQDLTATPHAPVIYQGGTVGRITSVTRTGRGLLIAGVLDSREAKAFRTLKARRIHRVDIDLTDGVIHELTFVSPDGGTPSMKDVESSIDATRRAFSILAAYHNDTQQ